MNANTRQLDYATLPVGRAGRVVTFPNAATR